jgi:hypothetical protein
VVNGSNNTRITETPYISVIKLQMLHLWFREIVTLGHSKRGRPLCGTCKGFRNRQLIYVYDYDYDFHVLVIELQNHLAHALKCNRSRTE